MIPTRFVFATIFQNSGDATRALDRSARNIGRAVGRILSEPRFAERERRLSRCALATDERRTAAEHHGGWPGMKIISRPPKSFPEIDYLYTP